MEIIQKLRVTNYRPLDKMTEGNSLRRGFVAQDVFEVLPQAVASRRNVIPDIYSKPTAFAFDQNQKTLSITLPKAHALTKGQVIQILTEDASKTVTVVEVPTAISFVVGEFEKQPMRVFVYGHEVDDFLSVHYEQIFTTGIGAIQELNKMVESKDARIASLERELSTLKQQVAANADVKSLQDENAAQRSQLAAQDNRLTELEAKDKTRDEKLAAIERLLQPVAKSAARPALLRTNGVAP